MRAYGNNHVDEGHPGANPITGIAWEMRRTAGNIVAIEEEIAALNEGALVEQESVTIKRSLQAELAEVIGIVDEDELPARRGEEYVLVKREQALHLWGELYLRERSHYKELVKLAFAVGFEKRRIDLIANQVTDINNVISGVIRALGHDPNSPEIRAKVREQILSVMPVPA